MPEVQLVLETESVGRGLRLRLFDPSHRRSAASLGILLFQGRPDAEARERDCLEALAASAIDLLLQRVSPGARRLLWILTRAHHPVAQEILDAVWTGRPAAEERLSQVRALLAVLPPDEERAALAQMPDHLKEAVEREEAPPPKRSPTSPLLNSLRDVGLVSREGEEGAWAFHELVRERVDAWMAAHAVERGERTEQEVWAAYGGRYAVAFRALQASGTEEALARALGAGRHGLDYLARAGDPDHLGWFVGHLVTSTREPSLLRGMVAELRALADDTPAGRMRWSVRAWLADALSNSGRPNAALPLYEQAALEAEAAEHWGDVGAICHNWAGALAGARNYRDRNLDAAKAVFERSAEASRRAGRPAVDVALSELEALRIAVMQGDAARALPGIECRLEQMRGWWKRRLAGEAVPEAPEPAHLGHALVSALDITRSANYALERWEACLALSGEIEETGRALGQSTHLLAEMRLNRCGPLISLGHLDEAQQVLETCLPVFRAVGDLQGEGTTLSALARVWAGRGYAAQAVSLERQALAVRNRMPEAGDRATSHHNLSLYLSQVGRKDLAAEHRMAAGCYYMAGEFRQALGDSRSQTPLVTWLRNLAADTRSARAAGEDFALPQVADLIGRPNFEALGQFLAERGIDPGALQRETDAVVVHVRQTT